MAIIIREANINDLNPLSTIFDHYRIFYHKESDVTAVSDFLFQRMNNKESTIFIAMEDDKIIGFVQLYPLFSSTRMKRLLLLNDLFVAENHRGKGVSTLLIERSKTLCREVDACGLMLETAKSNTIGNILYPKTGFVLDEEHNYYSWDR